MCVLAFAQPASALDFDESKIDALISKWNVPGAAIAIVRDGKVLYERGYGYVDAGESRAVDVDHSVFRIASVSKLITSAAVLKLVGEGKLSLDDKVFSVLSEYTPADPRAASITVRQLLDMTAGWDKNKSGDPILQPFISRAARRMHVECPPDFDVTARYWLESAGCEGCV